jgi:metal-sulfur cluster biosynthetic enzyme
MTESTPEAAPPADGTDAATPEAAPDAGAATDDLGSRPTPDDLMEVVRSVEDPELRMSVVELGLIYGIEIDDEGMTTVNMTLTSPGCPVGPMLQGQIYHVVSQLPGVEDVEVNIVWDPPWDPRVMASEEVKMMLGVW